jgi:hypothetical protein
MNCNHASRSLTNDGDFSRLPPDARQHIKSCRSCQNFIRVFAAPVSWSGPSWQTLDRIERILTDDLRPVTPAAPVRRVFMTLATALVALVLLIAHRLGAFGIGDMSALQRFGVFGVITIGAGLLVHSVLRQIVPGSRHLISPRLLPAAVVVSLALVSSALFQFQLEPEFWKRGWVCLGLGLPVGALAAVPLWMVQRRSAVLYPAMTGATTGLIAGLVGTSVLEIHCPNLDAWHKVVWHLGVAVVGSVAGLGLGLRAKSV